MKVKITIALLFTIILSSVCYGQRTIIGKNICYVKDYDLNQSRHYLDESSTLDPIEGIWVFEGRKYSIEKDFDGYQRNPNKFRAVIIELPGNNAWDVGDIQFFIEKGMTDNLFNVSYYAWIASWKGGNRTYNIKPVAGTCSLNNSASFILRVPNFDDYGTTTGTSRDEYIKLYSPKKQEQSFQVSQQGNTNQKMEWSGSGFAINNGYVVTNHHVVENAKQITILGVNGNASVEYHAEVVCVDKTSDLALLKIDDTRFKGFGKIPYAVRNIMCEVGADVFVLGFPLTTYMGEEIKLTNGIISSRTGFQGDVSTYQISAPVQPGNSGGPLFDDKGNIIGIVNAGIPGADNVGYAIKTSFLYNLVSTMSLSSSIPQTNTVTGITLADKVRQVKNFVFFIKCKAQ